MAVDDMRKIGTNRGIGTEKDPTAYLCTVTVTYNPDLSVLERQLRQLPFEALKVIVDNASSIEQQDDLVRIAERCGAMLVRNDRNLGLPAALNQGCRLAHNIREHIRHVLLLDQDSEPGGGSVEKLLARCIELERAEGKPCCVGPRLSDVSTGLEHGFHTIRGWRWSRVHPPITSKTPVRVTNLNGSGTLMPWLVFDTLGGLEDELFIDHVDTEWSFRVLAAGYPLFGVPDVRFQHRMGERSLRFWCFGWHVWPYRTPRRHYYLFRNAVRLLRRDYVPFVWKFWAVVKMGMTLVVHGLFDPERKNQVVSMIKGVGASAREQSDAPWRNV